MLTAVKIELELDGRHEAGALVGRALNQVRDLSNLLRPAALDDLGLVDALRALADDFSARTRIQVALDVDGATRRLPPDVEVVIYRVVQEALTNVARHARATDVDVRLITDADEVAHHRGRQRARHGRGREPATWAGWGCASASPRSAGSWRSGAGPAQRRPARRADSAAESRRDAPADAGRSSPTTTRWCGAASAASSKRIRASRSWAKPPTALEALALVRATAPDVIVLDLNMPGTGGLDVLPSLKAAQPSLKVVVAHDARRAGVRGAGDEGRRRRLPAQGLGRAGPRRCRGRGARRAAPTSARRFRR